MLHISDKIGPHTHLLEGFKDAIEECGLLKLDLMEGEYTWEKIKSTSNWVRERLDRTFADEHWWKKYQLCVLPANLSDTKLVLIPKKENIERMTDLCNTALCNVLYKIVAKVLANMLKGILLTGIYENQSAFVHDKSISDNVQMTFENIHYMKKKNIVMMGRWL
ncbi:hypothetical protein AgCh_011285 [Apium graveolens]